jgi:hypothetical protein
MWHDIAEAGKIDLVRLHYLAYRSFGSGQDMLQMQAICAGKIGHLAHMGTPDNAAETRKGLSFGASGADDAAPLVLPEDFAARGVAQFA